MFILNEQTQKEILQHGLKLDPTIKEIERLILNYGIVEDVNRLNITGIHQDTKQVYIYLVNYTENENGHNYNYLEKIYKKGDERWHPFTIKSYRETDTKKYILDCIKFLANTSEFLKAGKPQDNYKIIELENGKPNTLLNAKNKNFVCFFAVCDSYSDNSPSIKEFNITEEKETINNDFFKGIFSSWKDCDRARKDAIKIYACYNSKMAEYIEKQRVIKEKREQRKKDNLTKLLNNRYFYNNKDYQKFLHDFYYLGKWWNIAQCELSCTEADKIDPNTYIEFKGVKIYHGCTTRPQLYNYFFDKNGLCKIPFIADLKTRAKNLKRQREQEQKERSRQAWQNADHTNQQKEINNLLFEIKKEIESLLTFESVLNDYKRSYIKELAEIYESMQKQLNFNNYESLQEWESYKAEKIAKYDFYKLAIAKDVKKLGCYHQYEKTATGYKMAEKYYNDPFYKNYNYALEF